MWISDCYVILCERTATLKNMLQNWKTMDVKELNWLDKLKNNLQKEEVSQVAFQSLKVTNYK